MVGYIPDKCDIVYVDFTPQSGREQAGRRPAIVLSPKIYNEKTGLAIMCPITSKVKGYPFEVILPEKLSIDGVVLSDHIKNMDWQARNAEYVDKLDHITLSKILSNITVLLGL